MTELARTARLDILVEGYVRSPHVAGTVSLVRDADRVVVVDPGMVADRELILGPLRELGVGPDDVTDIVVSHHHLDHTVNIALFRVVPVHDFQSVIEGDVFTSRPAEGLQLTPSVRLHATPGPHAAGHHHPGRHRRGRRRPHPPLVDRGGAARRPVHRRPRGAAPAARARPRPRDADRPRSRRSVPPGILDAPLTRSYLQERIRALTYCFRASNHRKRTT